MNGRKKKGAKADGGFGNEIGNERGLKNWKGTKKEKNAQLDPYNSVG